MSTGEAMRDYRAYSSFKKMHQRCYSPWSTQYKWYGGRGIRVCERWIRFENFLADMGERPPGMSLDRIGNGGNYEPENCRWATATQQCRNRRTTKLREHQIKQVRWLLESGMTLKDVSSIYGVTIGCIHAHKGRND